MLHVCPEAHGKGKILPHALIFPDVLLAELNKRSNSVGFDLVLTVDADLLFHLQLHRKSVGVPSGLPRYHLALHGLVTRNQILDASGKHVSDMGLAVRCWRAVIEHITRIPFMLLD